MASPENSFASSDRQRYWLLIGCVVCQLATILITWPLWELRDTPPHLPLLANIRIPFGLLMVLSLSIVPIRPKIGLFVHLGVYALACVVDQFRTQPQLMAVILLMFAVTFEPMGRFTRWWLASLWIWAGLHKLLSPHWWGPASSLILSRIDADLTSVQTVFAAGIATVEIALGIAAIVRPRWAAIGCPLVHGGIIVFLSPLGINWNFSVIPWNLATAVIGCWLLQQPWIDQERRRWELIAGTALMIFPAGFYLSLVDHGMAAVLYSDYLPRAVVTTQTDTINVDGWGKLHVPFPNERRLYRTYFEQVGDVGDKMHIFDPRPALNDVYLLMNADKQIVEISRERFFRSRENEVAGIAVDDPLSVYRFKLAGATLLKRSPDEPVYAIRFSSERFNRDQLPLLRGLPNLEQIQFAGTDISDEDLDHLVQLPRLQGIGIADTSISDAGIERLQACPNLVVVEAPNTDVSEDAEGRFHFQVIRD